MTEILHSPQLSSSTSSICTNNDELHQPAAYLINHHESLISDPVALYRRNNGIQQAENQERVVVEVEEEEEEEGISELCVLDVLVGALRKSMVACRSITGARGMQELMEIGWPTNVRHVAHVTFDRFNGFLGLPVEFEPEVPRRPPSASTRVFGVSTESMQLTFDSRGNCVPTILLMMQRKLYSQGGLQEEGIFRITAGNDQEEYVREQLNNGVVPENIDVHCLAGLIKAWFRELPTGILDSLSPEQVMQAQTEEECTQLARHLPPTEAALLDWAVNLMADVAQMENLNKMNARNIAMVFAPNMTQMSDPLTALMYAVQVMNFLKMLVVRTLREREDSILEPGPAPKLEPPNEDGHHGMLRPIIHEPNTVTDDDQLNVANKLETCDEAPGFLNSIENILPDEKGHKDNTCPSDSNRVASKKTIENGKASAGSARNQTQPRSRRTKSGQPSNANVKRVPRKTTQQPCIQVSDIVQKKKDSTITSRINSHTEREEAWR